MMLDISVFCLDSQSISNGTDMLSVSHSGWQVCLFLASFDGAKVVVLVLCDHPEEELNLLSSLFLCSLHLLLAVIGGCHLCILLRVLKFM